MSLALTIRGLVAGLLINVLGFISTCDAQDQAQEIERLKAKLELTERTLELLEKECAELRKENARLKGDKAEPVAAAAVKDQFEVGVVWVGEAKGGGDKPTVSWALSISGRNGQKLDGVVAAVGPDGKKIEFPVSGTAPTTGNGTVVLESPVIGRAHAFMRGRVNNGEIALAFSVTTRLGEKKFGSATLRPRN